MKIVVKDKRLEGSTPLRQCQLAEVYLLDVFVEICKRYNLCYFLSYGTLLGAMRHNGFIPWDDDLDVAMPERDYEIFRRVASDCLPDNVVLDDPRMIRGMFNPNIRLRDRSSLVVSAGTNTNFPSGIYIDIYPYVKYPKLSKRYSYLLTYFCTETWLNVWIHRTLRHTTTIGILISWIKAVIWQVMRICSVFIYRVLRLLLPNVWHGPIEIGFPDGAYPSELPEAVLFPLGQHEFEGKVYNVPNDPDAYLTQRYGDWRKLPPEDKRVWHHSIICPTQAPNEWWARPWKKDAE